MAKHVVKVVKARGEFRVGIPRSVIKAKHWEDVAYVLIEDHWGDKILIRRFINDEALSDESTEHLVDVN